MKHLIHINESKSLTYSEEYDSVKIVLDIAKLFQKRRDLCIEIAKKHHFYLIKELVKPKQLFKCVLVFNNEKFPNDLEVENAVEYYTALYNEIDKLPPIVDEFTKKQIICRADIDRFDIKDWERSPKLSNINKKSGIFENSQRHPEFVNIDVWFC